MQNFEDIPQLLCTPSSTLSTLSTTTHVTAKPKPKKKVKINHSVFSKKEIKKLIKALKINKLGPSLIPFAVPCKFVSAFKIY